MPTIRFPLLKTDGPCQRLTVCGQLTGDVIPEGWTERPPNLDSQYAVEGHCNYVRALFHQKHLHVDMAVCGYFQSPPKAEDQISDLYAELDKAIGLEIDGGIEGEYRIPLSESPEVIRSFLRVEVKVGEVSLKMKGGDFEIGGAPATRIKWSVPPGSDNLCVFLETEIKTKVQESYLEDCFNKMQEIFNALFARR